MTRPSTIETPAHIAELRSVLRHEPFEGRLYWYGLKGARADRNGMEAGRQHKAGYRHFSYRKRNYLVHRVLWALHYDAWPAGYIDHINRDRADNRIENLRVVSQSQNMFNMSDRERLLGPDKGVHMSGEKFCAYVSAHRKRYHLGTYDTLAEARAARVAGEILLHKYEVKL